MAKVRMLLAQNVVKIKVLYLPTKPPVTASSNRKDIGKAKLIL